MTAPPLHGLRVVVVEDQPSVRVLMIRVLQEAGAEVTTVASVREALEALSHVTPDVIVSDIRMPEEDGYDLIRKVRALPEDRGARIPMVAVSASVSPDEAPRLLAAGFTMFVSKPFELAELVRAVAAAAGRRNS
jgi:CheY-like chemotaxis protein